MESLFDELGIPKKYLKPTNRDDRFIALVHKNWLKTLIKHSKLPDFTERCKTETWPYTKDDLEESWSKIFIRVFKKRESKVIPLPCIRKNSNEEHPLLIPQLMEYIHQTNYKNLWKEASKKYSTSDANKTKQVTLVDYNEVLKEIIIRIYGCPIINTYDSELTVENVKDFEVHQNIYPCLAGVETLNAIFLIHSPYFEHNLQDCVTFSPSILEKCYTKPLFLIYQILNALKALHERSLTLGEITLSDIYLTEDLWIYIFPELSSNIHIQEVPKSESQHDCRKSGHKFDSNLICLNCGVKSYDKIQVGNENLEKLCELWVNGQISNYTYLMSLNSLSGRRFGDPNCHYVFPWVTDFASRCGKSWRDLKKSKFRLNKGDRQLDLTYENPVTQIPHHVSDVLSSITYYVYMSRRTPKSVLCKNVRTVWVPAEYPSSIQRLQEWTPDECIPEFFSDPTVFKSIHDDLDDLEVPSWCSGPEDFVEKHREALESQHVSERLHLWIDLTFGYRLAGHAAVRSKNVCLQLVDGHTNLTTSGVVQLFMHPHPPKAMNLPFWGKIPPKVYVQTGKQKRDHSTSSTTVSIESCSRSEEEDDDLSSRSPLSKLHSRSRSSLNEDSKEKPGKNIQQRSTSLGPKNASFTSHITTKKTSSSLNTGIVTLPKEFQPAQALINLENLHNFFAKTFHTEEGKLFKSQKQLDFDEQKQDFRVIQNAFTNKLFESQIKTKATKSFTFPIDNQNILPFRTKSRGFSEKVKLENQISCNYGEIIVARRVKELQVLGCLILEIFMAKQLRVLQMANVGGGQEKQNKFWIQQNTSHGHKNSCSNKSASAHKYESTGGICGFSSSHRHENALGTCVSSFNKHETSFKHEKFAGNSNKYEQSGISSASKTEECCSSVANNNQIFSELSLTENSNVNKTSSSQVFPSNKAEIASSNEPRISSNEASFCSNMQKSTSSNFSNKMEDSSSSGISSASNKTENSSSQAIPEDKIKTHSCKVEGLSSTVLPSSDQIEAITSSDPLSNKFHTGDSSLNKLHDLSSIDPSNAVRFSSANKPHEQSPLVFHSHKSTHSGFSLSTHQNSLGSFQNFNSSHPNYAHVNSVGFSAHENSAGFSSHANSAFPSTSKTHHLPSSSSGFCLSKTDNSRYCKNRVSNRQSLIKRVKSCLTILTSCSQEIPSCVKNIVNLLLQPGNTNLDEFKYPAVTDLGLPPPTAHMLLEPLLHQLIPFNENFYTLYALISNLKEFESVSEELEILYHFDCDGEKCLEYENIERAKILLAQNISECKVRACARDLEDLFDDLSTVKDAEIIALLVPHIKNLIDEPPTSILAAWYLFDPVAKFLGPAKTSEFLLRPILRLYETDSNTPHFVKIVKLYHHSFLLRLIVRFGLRKFLEHFSTPLVEAVGGYRDQNFSVESFLHTHAQKNLTRKTSNLKSIDDVNEKTDLSPGGDDSSGSEKITSSQKAEREVEVFDFETEQNLECEDQPLQSLIEHLELNISSDLPFNHSSAEEALDVVNLEQELGLNLDEIESQGASTGLTSPNIPIPSTFKQISCDVGSKRNDELEHASAESRKTEDPFIFIRKREEKCPVCDVKGRKSEGKCPICDGKRSENAFLVSKIGSAKSEDTFLPCEVGSKKSEDAFTALIERCESEDKDYSPETQSKKLCEICGDALSPSEIKSKLPIGECLSCKECAENCLSCKSKCTACRVSEDAFSIPKTLIEDCDGLAQSKSTGKLGSVQSRKSLDDEVKSSSSFSKLRRNEAKISSMSADSLIWLSHRLGPVLTARYLSRNLLKMLTLCYVGRENLVVHSVNSSDSSLMDTMDLISIANSRVVGDKNAAKVLECLASIAALYGEQLILLQYLPHMSELIALCKRKLTPNLEGGLISCLALLKHIIPYICDSTLMDQLQDVILKNILHPSIRLLGSTKYAFPNGSMARNVLARKYLDTLYVLSLRMGADMTRTHLAVPALQRFFLIFDKISENSAYFGGANTINEQKNESQSKENLLRSIEESHFLEVRRDGTIAEWAIGGRPVQISHVRLKDSDSTDSLSPPKLPNSQNSASVSGGEESVGNQALEELQAVFTPELAHTAYIPFLKQIGQQSLESSLKNHANISNLCQEYEKELKQTITSINNQMNDLLEQQKANASSSVNTSSIGSNVALIGNRIDVQEDQDLKNTDILSYISNKMENNVRHLRGNWLAYWEHEIGRSDKDVMFNFKQIKLQTFVGHSQSIKSLHVLDNENSFLSGSRDKTVKLWSLRSLGDGTSVSNCQSTYTSHKKSVLAIAFLDGLRLVASCDSVVHLWDPFMGASVGVLESPKNAPVNVLKGQRAPSSLLFAATTEGTLRVIDARICSYIHELKVTINPTVLIRCLAVSPSGNWIATGQASGQITVLDTRNGLVMASWRAHEGELLQIVAFNEDTIISSSFDQSVSVWNVHDGKFKFHMNMSLNRGGSEPVHCLNLYNNELISGSTANRIGVHTSVDRDASFSSTKLRSDAFKGLLSSMAVLPLNRLLLLGADTGNIHLLC